MKETISQVLFSAEQIHKRVEELGAQITQDYKGKEPLIVVVLKGSTIFAADLIRAIGLPIRLDFISTSSYGNSTESSGVVKILKDVEESLEGKDVIIIEDIVDTGLTLTYLVRTLQLRNPASLKVCSLLDKPSRRKPESTVKVDYLGYSIDDHFVVGYGLDYASRHRNLPYVGVLKLEQ